MLGSSPKNKFKRINLLYNKLFTYSLWILTALVLILIFGLLIYILSKGLAKFDFDFLIDLPDEIETGGGVGPFLINSHLCFVHFISYLNSYWRWCRNLFI